MAVIKICSFRMALFSPQAKCVMRVLITGADGQLGQELKSLLSVHEEVFAYDLDLDITDRDLVVSKINKVKPEVVFHCAAMTDVDGCERDPDRATAANDEGTGHVVLACQQVNAIMVYISTDFVFDGESDRAYNEADLPRPLNVYGRTKLAGERRVAGGLDRYYIVRTSWLFGRSGSNFIRTILRLADEEDRLDVVDDQTGSPTYAKDLAEKIIELVKTNRYGLYHISNSGKTTWFGFAKEILAGAGKEDVTVRPLKSVELDRPAKRPAFSVLANNAIGAAGLSPMRYYGEALLAYMNEADKGES